MKTTKIISVLMVLFMAVANFSFAQNTNAQKYAKLVYMGKSCELDQNFFIGYQSIYNANITKLCKKQKDRADWDRISNEIIGYLTNPSLSVVYDEMGTISFAGGNVRLDGNYTDKSRNKQERKDNEKAAKLYGSILSTTIPSWYKKYQIK